MHTVLLRRNYLARGSETGWRQSEAIWLTRREIFVKVGWLTLSDDTMLRSGSADVERRFRLYPYSPALRGRAGFVEMLNKRNVRKQSMPASVK